MKETLNNFLELAKKKRVLAAFGLISLFVCIFFTYVKYTVLRMVVRIRLIEFLEGKLMILLILLNAMFIFKDYVKKYFPKLFQSNIGKKIENINDQRLTLIPTVLVIIFAFVVKGETKVDYLNLTFGFGFYLMWLGALSLIAHAFIYKNDKIKGFANTATKVQQPQNIAGQPVQNNEVNNNSVITNQSQVNTVIQDTNQVINSSKFCTNCGSKCESTQTKCPACGKEF